MKTRTLLCAAALACSPFAQAEFLDVIAFKLKPACTMADFIQLNKEMNDWGKKYNMTSEVAVPVFSDNPAGSAWLGRTPNAAAFGKVWDAWRTAVDNADPVVKKMNDRWSECTETVYRRGFDTY